MCTLEFNIHIKFITNIIIYNNIVIYNKHLNNSLNSQPGYDSWKPIF